MEPVSTFFLDKESVGLYIVSMQVIFGSDQADRLKDKFTLLELDTFMEQGLDEPITAYAILGMQEVQLAEIPNLAGLIDVHNTMLKEYKKRNWNYCHQALEHLHGKWSGQLDSFYKIFEDRVKDLESRDLPDDWDGTIVK